ncbi:hypothetical protein [Yersinia pseudotuberculosis]
MKITNEEILAVKALITKECNTVKFDTIDDLDNFIHSIIEDKILKPFAEKQNIDYANTPNDEIIDNYDTIIDLQCMTRDEIWVKLTTFKDFLFMQNEIGLSITETAKAIDVPYRTYYKYATGENSIPAAAMSCMKMLMFIKNNGMLNKWLLR